MLALGRFPCSIIHTMLALGRFPCSIIHTMLVLGRFPCSVFYTMLALGRFPCSIIHTMLALGMRTNPRLLWPRSFRVEVPDLACCSPLTDTCLWIPLDSDVRKGDPLPLFQPVWRFCRNNSTPYTKPSNRTTAARIPVTANQRTTGWLKIPLWVIPISAIIE